MPQDDVRSRLTFLEAEGLVPLPTVLSPRTVGPSFRPLVLWFVERIFESRYNYHTNQSPHRDLFGMAWIKYFHRWAGDFPSSYGGFLTFLRKWLEGSNDASVLDFVQILSRLDLKASELDALKKVVESEHIAYELIGDGDDDNNIPTLYPKVSSEQAEALRSDMRAVAALSAQGPATHLQAAAQRLQDRDYRSSVRESVSAVESVARKYCGDEKATLGEALNRIRGDHEIHPALVESFKKMYGWTSDAQGIRHALVDDPEQVDERLAVLMLSSCAAFVAYLAGELEALS